MKRLIAFALVFALVTPTLGCYHNQIIVQKNYDASKQVPDHHSAFDMYLLWGLVHLGDDVSVSKLCPTGAGLMEVETSFINGLLTMVLGLGLIGFQDVKVSCAVNRGAIDLSTDATVATKD